MDLKGRVLVYSIVGCPHCLRAKNRLAQLGLSYVDVSLDSYPQVRDEVKKRTGGKTTVPQIFFNEVYIGGNDELQALVKDKGRMQEMMEMLKNIEPPPSSPPVPDPQTAVDYGKDSAEFVCEPDEYARLVDEMKKAKLIKDHREGLKTEKQTFKGQDFIDWLMKEKKLDRQKAMEMGQELIGRNFGHQVVRAKDESFSPDKFYRLLENDESRALNAGAISECEPLPAAELGESLRRLILKILDKGLSKDGRSVDYKKIAAHTDFDQYVKLTKQLQRVDVISCSREEKLSFFINVYNALVIHGTIKTGPPANMWQRYKFFNTTAYLIGGNTYSLQDIENGVLRGNRKGVGMFRRPFGSNDPRLKVALEEAEPLIHFALNCGAKSCPPIKTFSAKGIKAELKVAAEAFLETDEALKVSLKDKKVELSQIFKWYQEDFGKSGAKAVRWAVEHMTKSDKRDELTELLNRGVYTVSYISYDWGHNSRD